MLLKASYQGMIRLFQGTIRSYQGMIQSFHDTQQSVHDPDISITIVMGHDVVLHSAWHQLRTHL